MITRYYICDNCGHELSVRQNLHDEKRLKRCPKCKKHALYQDLSGQHTHVYQEPKTLGHLASRNTERFGKYELESKQNELQINREKAKVEAGKQMGILPENATKLPDRKSFYNPEGKDLKKELKDVIKSPKKIKDYIIKGEK